VQRELFVQSNQRVRVLRLVQRAQPLDIGVPIVKPRRAVATIRVQPGIFEDAQRQVGPPIKALETNGSLFILRQVGDGQIAQVKLPCPFATRKNEHLLIGTAIKPDWIAIRPQIVRKR
jgi:hypothetical protein